MKRYRMLVTLTFFALVGRTARADIVNVTASARGAVNTTGVGQPSSSNNGNLADNSYFAGEFTFSTIYPTYYRNWFEFAIPTLTGESLTGATLSLDEHSSITGSNPALDGHVGGTLTYAVYGLTGQPLVFNDVVTLATNPFGSILTSAVAAETTISITLNADALTAIAAAHGGNIFIGGIDSGELSVANGYLYDFGWSSLSAPTYPNQTILVLTTAPSAPVPEPNGLLLVGMLVGTVIAVMTGTRRWRQNHVRSSFTLFDPIK